MLLPTKEETPLCAISIFYDMEFILYPSKIGTFYAKIQSPENSRTITHNYIIRPYIDSEKFRLYFNFDYNDSTFVNQFKYTFSHHIETILQMKSIDWSIIDWKLTH